MDSAQGRGAPRLRPGIGFALQVFGVFVLSAIAAAAVLYLLYSMGTP
ncbi:MAG TPA: hypothetical protein VML50_07140 [Anaeromyxobacter sp.]|nr:hypothetical protein [Anaeromyxobacter sp.]